MLLSPPRIKATYGQWSTITPSPAIRIVGVTSTGVADCNLHSDGFSAFYFWGDNGVNFAAPQVTIDCHGATHQNGYAGSLSQHIQSSRYLGWQAQCNQSSCTPTGAGIIVFSVLAISLEAQETSGPSLTATPANNLWYQSGWVRGAFPADLVASDPSGVCAMQTTVNGHAISSYSDPSPDTTQWMQCPNHEIDANVDTTSYPDGAGAISLTYSASNAAGAASTVSKALNVDNVTPSVTLSAPADTASASGDQTVTAVASGGPSGIAAISCSVDGGPTQTYDGATAQVPVAGIGPHQVSCDARNNAVNASGVTATSPTATLDLSVRQPTASAITFARIADALQCRTAVERVKVAGRVRTVRRHGKRVRVRGRARTVQRRVRKCHARTVVRTVRVVLKRHGKPVLRHGRPVYVKRRVRRVVLPHAVNEPARRVGHGKSTTVNGFVGLADGTALAGQTVDVYSSPADNAPRFRVMRTVTTDASGEWSAKVPAGPSRLIEAVYPGNATTEPASSSAVTLTVPGADRDAYLPTRGAVVAEDHDHRPSGRRMGASRRSRAAAARPVPRGPFPPRAVPHQLARPVQLPVDLRVRAGRRGVPVRRRHDGDRIRLSLGRRGQPGDQGHVRATHAAETKAPSARLTGCMASRAPAL